MESEVAAPAAAEPESEAVAPTAADPTMESETVEPAPSAVKYKSPLGRWDQYSSSEGSETDLPAPPWGWKEVPEEPPAPDVSPNTPMCELHEMYRKIKKEEEEMRGPVKVSFTVGSPESNNKRGFLGLRHKECVVRQGARCVVDASTLREMSSEAAETIGSTLRKIDEWVIDDTSGSKAESESMVISVSGSRSKSKKRATLQLVAELYTELAHEKAEVEDLRQELTHEKAVLEKATQERDRLRLETAAAKERDAVLCRENAYLSEMVRSSQRRLQEFFGGGMRGNCGSNVQSRVGSRPDGPMFRNPKGYGRGAPGHLLS